MAPNKRGFAAYPCGAPVAFVDQALMGALGPCGPGHCGLLWALVGWDPVGPLAGWALVCPVGPRWAAFVARLGTLWGRTLVGPPGPFWAGP